MKILNTLFGKTRKTAGMEPMSEESIPQISMPNIFGLDVLVIADTHGRFDEEALKEQLKTPPPAVFLLGDIEYPNLERIVELCTGLPIFGVLGNHDDKTFFNDLPQVEHLNGRMVTFHGIRIAGLSGSVRYKESANRCMITQEESKRLLMDVPDCDILITHDKPCFGVPQDYDAHGGLVGIAEYIKNHSPKFVLHGHMHEPGITKYKDTYIRCCYNIERIIL